MEREDREGGSYPGGESPVATEAPNQPKGQDHVGGVQQDIAEVVAEGVLEAEEPRVQRPTHIPKQKGLFAGEGFEEDRAKARPEGVLVVELGVGEEDRAVVEVHEVEAETPSVQQHGKQKQHSPDTELGGCEEFAQRPAPSDLRGGFS